MLAKMENTDANGVAHYPGWSLAALKYLYEERKIAASGHETTDTDPGTATSKDD
jgi:kynurenine formamidase